MFTTLTVTAVFLLLSIPTFLWSPWTKRILSAVPLSELIHLFTLAPALMPEDFPHTIFAFIQPLEHWGIERTSSSSPLTLCGDFKCDCNLITFYFCTLLPFTSQSLPPQRGHLHLWGCKRRTKTQSSCSHFPRCFRWWIPARLSRRPRHQYVHTLKGHKQQEKRIKLVLMSNIIGMAGTTNFIRMKRKKTTKQICKAFQVWSFSAKMANLNRITLNLQHVLSSGEWDLIPAVKLPILTEQMFCPHFGFVIAVSCPASPPSPSLRHTHTHMLQEYTCAHVPETQTHLPKTLIVPITVTFPNAKSVQKPLSAQ